LWEAHVELHASTGDVVHSLIESLPEKAGIDAVGHRIVHGGKAFRESTRITMEVKEAIVRLASLAPEHNLLEVEAIETVERLLPGVPQIAVFDTAFHATLAADAYTYPGPYSWLDQGIRRYGFHGISHQYVSARAAELAGRDLASLRMITCHLGNGCSLAAIREGRSVETTMGFTPLEGLMMGTRSGSIDPGILIHLIRHCSSTAEDLDRILNKESGLKGISGVSGDMREILRAMEQGHERAKLAFDIYTLRLASAIASLLPVSGGIDLLIFTAGVGENCAPLRRTVCDRFGFLNWRVDSPRNESGRGEDREISSPDSAVRVFVIHTREELEIARQVSRINL
jgi:acetate kinase